MNTHRFLFLMITFIALAITGCSDRSSAGSGTVSQGAFILTSDGAADGGRLPAEYACDGAGSTIALSWSNAPAGTTEFALMMTTLPGDGTTKWNWVLYGIPGSADGLAKNSTGVGIAGTGSHGTTMAYDPPCSQGPGDKVYTFTLYALSASPSITVPTAEVTGPVLSNAISSLTLSTAALSLIYARSPAVFEKSAAPSVGPDAEQIRYDKRNER